MMMMKLKQSLVALLLSSLYLSQGLATEHVAISPGFQQVRQLTAAPDFFLNDLEGQTKSLDSYPGKLLLLHFWATWCEPCRKELPALTALWEKFQDQGLVVIAIAEDSKQAVVPFVNSTNLTLPVLIDQYGSALRAYQIKGLPTSYLVIKKTRHIEEVVVGQRDWENPTVVRAIEEILSRR